MKFKSLPIVIALASCSSMAHASNLSYTYAELGGGLGKLTVETAGRSYDFKSKGFGGTFSYQLSPDYYVSLSHQMATVDEIDSSRGVALKLDGDMKQTEGLFGYAYHINQDTDFTVEAGASHNNNDLSGKFIPGNNYAIRDKKTKLIWSLGVRSIWVESGFELYGKVLGEGDGLGFTVGGPMYLTENLAIDLSYTFMKNKHGNDKTKLSALGLSLRSYF